MNPARTGENRYVEIGPGSPRDGRTYRASLTLIEGAALDERLDQVAATVCGNDPRTKDQRRTDALMGMSNARRRACNAVCGSADCPATAARTSRWVRW